MPEDKTAQSGRLGNLTPKQAGDLELFKKLLQQEGVYTPGTGRELPEMFGGGLHGASHSDATLLRFLRARKFDLAASQTMFTKSQAWRKDFASVGTDALYSTFQCPNKEQVDAMYPRYYHKVDKQGRPLYIEQMAKNLTEVEKYIDKETQLQRLVVEYEKFLRDRLPICSYKEGRLIETSCTIMDLGGVGVTQASKFISYVQEAADVSQSHYPETMGKFYIINVPYVFYGAWYLIRPFLNEVTLNKIVILDSNYKKVLLEDIGEDNLPVALGGRCKCPGGCGTSDAGPWQDEKLVQEVKDAMKSYEATP